VLLGLTDDLQELSSSQLKEYSNSVFTLSDGLPENEGTYVFSFVLVMLGTDDEW
jgi:hypothetical protein